MYDIIGTDVDECDLLWNTFVLCRVPTCTWPMVNLLLHILMWKVLRVINDFMRFINWFRTNRLINLKINLLNLVKRFFDVQQGHCHFVLWLFRKFEMSLITLMSWVVVMECCALTNEFTINFNKKTVPAAIFLVF